MRLIKFSTFAAALGFVFILISIAASNRLAEAKNHSFPESLGRHYAQVSNRVFEGGSFGSDQPTEFKKSIPVTEESPIETVEIETNSVDIELLPSETETIDISLVSNRVDPKEPVLVDTSAGALMRILVREGEQKTLGRNGWFVFNIDDGDGGGANKKKRNVLQIKLPKRIKNVQIQSISGDGELATALNSVRFQSKSGDFTIATQENPLARVESLIVETVSGDLKTPGRFDRLRFNSISGDVKLSSFDRVLDIDAQSVSGDLKIQSNEPVDADITFTSQSGDLRVEPSLAGGTGQKPLKAEGSANFKLGKGTTRIKFQSVSGDLKIKKASSADDSDGDDDDHDENANESSADFDDDSSDETALISPDVRGVVLASSRGSADSSFLMCVARLAITDSTRLGSTSARRCYKLMA